MNRTQDKDTGLGGWSHNEARGRPGDRELSEIDPADQE
jgi:hypothetical protein